MALLLKALFCIFACFPVACCTCLRSCRCLHQCSNCVTCGNFTDEIFGCVFRGVLGYCQFIHTSVALLTRHFRCCLLQLLFCGLWVAVLQCAVHIFDDGLLFLLAQHVPSIISHTLQVVVFQMSGKCLDAGVNIISTQTSCYARTLRSTTEEIAP